MSAPNKVTVILNNAGGAPVLQKHLRKVTVSEEDPFAKVIAYLRKLLDLDKTEGASLFVYLKSSFTPDPREKVGILADAFGSSESGSKTLALHYSLTPAWG